MQNYLHTCTYTHQYACIEEETQRQREREMKGWAPKCYWRLSQRHEFQVIFALYFNIFALYIIRKK